MKNHILNRKRLARVNMRLFLKAVAMQASQTKYRSIHQNLLKSNIKIRSPWQPQLHLKCLRLLLYRHRSLRRRCRFLKLQFPQIYLWYNLPHSKTRRHPRTNCLQHLPNNYNWDLQKVANKTVHQQVNKNPSSKQTIGIIGSNRCKMLGQRWTKIKRRWCPSNHQRKYFNKS